MDKAEAREIVRQKKGDLPQRWMVAMTLISSPDCAFQDLLDCVRHGGEPAEWAAIELYKRTRRPRKGDTLASFVMDAADWESYLRQHNLL